VLTVSWEGAPVCIIHVPPAHTDGDGFVHFRPPTCCTSAISGSMAHTRTSISMPAGRWTG
jgi:hypothetical protein